MYTQLVILFIMVGVGYSKLYCHSCLMTNGSLCENRFSQCRRCPDDMQMEFYCYERKYNISDTEMVSEKDCIRKDFYDAEWPCFENLKNCWSRKCSTHMCNSAIVQQASTMLTFITLTILLFMKFVV